VADSRRATSWVTLVAKSTKIIKVLKVVKVLKPMITLFSMGLSVFVYSFTLGFAFALGFVLLLFCHEVGHVVALRRKKIKASMPIFIPMLGAAVFAPKLDERHDEAYMAYAGPLFGMLSGIALLVPCLLLAHPPQLLVLLTFNAFLLNLFNLTPLSPLDGGRVTQAVGPWFKYIGVAVLLGLTLYLHTAGIVVIWIVVVFDMPIAVGKRLALCCGLQVLMVLMAFTPLGAPQPLVVSVIDLLLATLLNTLLLALYLTKTPVPISTDERPHLGRRQRMQWLAGYLAMATSLVLLMIWAGTLLPPGVVR